MKNKLRIFFVIFSLFSVSLSGCIESADVPRTELQGETLAEVQNPCLIPTESDLQATIAVMVDGQERLFRLSIPN